MDKLTTLWSHPENAEKDTPVTRYEYKGRYINEYAGGKCIIEYASPMTLYAPNHIHDTLISAIKYIDSVEKE